MNVSLQWVHIDLFLQVNSQESCAYVHVMDLKIIDGGDHECQPNVAQASSQCIRSLVLNAFDLVFSSTDLPGLEPLHIAHSIALDLVYPVTLQSLSLLWKLHEISKDMMLTNCI